MRTFIYTLLILSVFGCRTSTDDQSDSNTNTNNYNPSNNDQQGNIRRSTTEALSNETNVDDDGITFMKMASSSNVFEIELGKLAQQKAMNERVKNFAAMMVRDHTKNDSELKSLAVDKNVLVSYSLKPEQKQQISELQKLNGKAFDKRYMQIMMSGHVAGIQNFESGADNRDNAVNRFANKALPLLKIHMDSARAIHASLK